MQLEFDHGQLWSTDAPLREGMERIRAAVVMAQQADTQDRLEASQAQALVAAVENSTAFMVQNCRLEPKADANLHILLGRLSVAATAIKANPKAAERPVENVRGARHLSSLFYSPGVATIHRTRPLSTSLNKGDISCTSMLVQPIVSSVSSST